jgi:glycosyltransferase involved in cell wall biosynthesis
MKPRILHVIDHTQEGGAQVALLNLLPVLADRFSFSVAVLGNSGRFSAAYQARGIPVLKLGRNGCRWSLASGCRLPEVIRSEQIDLVHSHLFKANVLGPLAAMATGRSFIVHDHSDTLPEALRVRPYFSNRLVRYGYLLLYRYSLRRSALSIVLSTETRDSYERLYAVESQKLAVLPWGIDVRQFNRASSVHRQGSLRQQLGLPDATKLVLGVGRLEPEKDWRTFLDVAAKVSKSYTEPCTFVVVGSGSQEAELQEFTRTRGLRQVLFLGYRVDVPDLLREADVFLLTSRAESFAIVVLEAMAAECPVVATRCGGPSSILTDGVDGFLADVGDVQRLASHVTRLLGDKSLRTGIGQLALKTVAERYSAETVASGIADIYRSVLAR